MNTAFDPVKASGAENYNAPRGLELNEVTLNGDGDAVEREGKLIRKGGYFRKRMLVDKPKDQKPDEVNLSNPITVVMLKIRRKLVQRGHDGKVIRSTSEHNHKGEAVMLYEHDSRTPVVGIASDLREKYEGLRTVQIVYALLCEGPNEPELVKLTIRGSALGSDSQKEDRTNFYQYLGSFGKDDKGNKEHFYQYKTILNAVIEEGKKTYFTIDFKRGSKLDPKTYEYALKRMEEVHNKCVEIDDARVAKIASGATVETEVPQEEDTAPTDEINPDDIPF